MFTAFHELVRYAYPSNYEVRKKALLTVSCMAH